MTRAFPTLLMLTCLAALAACGDEVDKLIEAPCSLDTHCGEGAICQNSQCVPASALSCASVAGGTAILQPEPSRIAFPAEIVGYSSDVIVLRNVGNCTLTVFEAYLEKGADSPFGCPDCLEERFPREVFPFRDFEIEVSHETREVGEFRDNLILLSDDAEFPEIKIPLHALFRGVPEIHVAPNPLDFGYVALGRPATKLVSVSNIGEGTAEVQVTSIRVEPAEGTDFTLPVAFTEPQTLPTIAVDPEAGFKEFAVKFQPRSVASHQAELVIETDDPQRAVIRVPLTGTSETPPAIRVTPEAIRLGEVILGRTVTSPLTIVNEGGAPLTVALRWQGNQQGDLGVQPGAVEPIQPGQFVELNVIAAPTVEGAITATLMIESNDPSRPSIAVPVEVIGRDLGQTVIKVELGWDNGNDGTFDEDLRNVDLAMENPHGLVCSQREPNPASWGEFGEPHWMILGAKGEPERIVLVGAQRAGTYRVMLSYAEDCQFLPTGLLASLLGLSSELIIGYITGGVVGGVGDDISNAISEACFDHGGTTAQLTVSANGAVIGEKAVPLGAKGDFVYALDLDYADGVYTIR